MIKRNDIQIRDPFVLTHDGKYYLYGTTDKDCWGEYGYGFDCYISEDLDNWQGPIHAFVPPSDFWADRNFWAPEVYEYKNRFYMFATFKSDDGCRGTQILSAASPDGPFAPHSAGAVTPMDWECLDGTLYIDAGGSPWMIFCHEWTQVGDGAMCAVRLSDDLTHATDEPVELFHASEAPWTTGVEQDGKKLYITDGPYMYCTKKGSLLMIWSSVSKSGYAIGISRSLSGSVDGEWKHEKKMLFSEGGGHGMIFRDFNGRLFVALHAPNQTPNERACFFEVEEKRDTLVLKNNQ